jgi:hypothetical protein
MDVRQVETAVVVLLGSLVLIVFLAGLVVGLLF